MNNTIISSTKTLRVSWQDSVCVIDFHDETKSMNAFSKEILSDLDKVVSQALATPGIAGLVMTSSKPGCFSAGVDISIFGTLTSQKAGEEASSTLHALFQKFADANVPTIAAINGVCIGGGVELALACHYRICSSHHSTQLGLPEIQLGLLPGGGGTQRLPRVIGVAPALDLILTGKKVDAKKSLKLGLVSEVVPENQLVRRAVELCKTSQPIALEKKKSGLGFLGHMKSSELASLDMQKLALETNSIGRTIIERKTIEQIEKNTKGFYPAPKKALEAVMKGLSRPLSEGLKIEAKLFGDLVVTPESRSLVHIFRMITAAKKNPFDADAQKASRETVLDPLLKGETFVGMVGAGLMGSGIATVLSDKNIRCALLDRDGAGVQRGLKGVQSYFDERMKKRRIKKFDRDAALGRIIPTVNLSTFAGTPFVIEAVFEDLAVKHDMLKRCENAIEDENFVFASNTSSLPIGRIAAAARHPENVVGMHFFSPVPKMPLVEIITTDNTSPRAASAAFEIANKMGKNIIVVKDGPGFYTTRILAFLIAEALNILSEGASIEEIDQALERFGMPVGPITLLDEVGIDVGAHIIAVLKDAFAERIVIPPELNSIIAEDRKGRKNGRGFYTYVDGRKDKPDATIYKHLKHGDDRKRFDMKDIADRCMFVFMNEAARCLDEGIINTTETGDLGAIFGLGFPPFLGGPFHYAQQLGYARVSQTLTEMAQKYGPRFAPASHWTNSAR
ncbi:fatty acid oxidation complex subunit alpha FadJ [bacterium]|nr:fatty acid oxidation complex subunit alpha FadJ [bacterium]